MRRVHVLALLAVLAVSAGLHAHRAAHPTSSFQSADERSYGKLAVNLVEHRRYGAPGEPGARPFHWPPGAPFLFAAGHAAFGQKASERTYDIPAAYWLHAVLGVGTALCAFGLARALAGPWPGVAAAGLVGTYPPLVLATGEQISEPFGAFLLTAALFVLALAVGRRSVLGYALAGALLGATVLTRADLLLVPGLAAAVLGVVSWRRARDLRRALVVAGALAGGAAAVVLPWVVHASASTNRFVPVTQGSAAPLFVGTYLPGSGHTVGMKRALEAEVKRFRPRLRRIPAFEIPAAHYMDMIAARHPSLPRDEAIRREARRNLVRYATGEPLRFAVMMGDKVQRMWTRYARGGARHTSWAIRAWHIVLVLAGFAGLTLGVLRGRSPVLTVIALAALLSTALHLIVVSQARYNLPLMPSVVAGGVAGWVLWRRRAADRTRGGVETPSTPSPVEPMLHA